MSKQKKVCAQAAPIQWCEARKVADCKTLTSHVAIPPEIIEAIETQAASIYWCESRKVDGCKTLTPHVEIPSETIEAIGAESGVKLDADAGRRLEALISGRVQYVNGLIGYGTYHEISFPTNALPLTWVVSKLAADLASAINRCDQGSNGRAAGILNYKISRRFGVDPLEVLSAIREVYDSAGPSRSERKQIGRGDFIRAVRDQVLRSAVAFSNSKLEKRWSSKSDGPFRQVLTNVPVAKLITFLDALNRLILVPLDQAGVTLPPQCQPQKLRSPNRKGEKRLSISIGARKAIQMALSREVAVLDKQVALSDGHWIEVQSRLANK